MRNLAYRLLSLLIVFMLAGCALAEDKSNATATIILQDRGRSAQDSTSWGNYSNDTLVPPACGMKPKPTTSTIWRATTGNGPRSAMAPAAMSCAAADTT